MSRNKKMTPAQKAAARWNADENDTASNGKGHTAPAGEDESANGDHFIISLVLIGVVSIVAIVFTTIQGGVPF